MSRRLAAVLVTVGILTLTYGMFFALFNLQDRQTPHVVAGKLDVTGWHFTGNKVIPLDGEWEFYPNRLVSHEELSAAAMHANPSAALITVPGSWSPSMHKLGMATYRLQIKIDDTSHIYGLKTLSIQMSNRIMVNGKVVGTSGIPGDMSSYEAKNKPYVCYFTLKPGWNEIIVQVANYDFPASSGINKTIFLGTAEQISTLRDTALAHDWIIFGCFLIMGLYFIGLYIQRVNDYSLLAFGFLCIFLSTYSATSGEKILLTLFDSIPFWLYIRVQIISVYGGGMMMLLYAYTAFRPFCSRRLIRAGFLTGFLLIVVMLGFIRFSYDGIMPIITSLYGTLPFLYVTYVFVLAAFHKVEGSVYLIVAAIALNAHTIVQNLYVYFDFPVYSIMPFEPFLFLLMIALLMSLRFSNAFKQIEELSVQLLKADKLKDEFLLRTSHEFKTPLHSVMTISQSMLDEDAPHTLHEEQREKLALMINITKKLSQLVYDILDFSKLKQGDIAIHPVSMDVRSTVEVVVRIFSFLTEGKKLEIINLVPEDLPYVFADENRFIQILNNLLDNAVKHTAQGSITISAVESNGNIIISIIDTGEGIEQQDLDRIFEPFTSFDTAESQSFGLGLSIVKQLIHLQSGDISVHSKKGEGTTFTFWLPAAKKGSRPKMESLVHSSNVKVPEYSFTTPYYFQKNGAHTILLVDDHFSNLKILIDALKPLGCNVIAVKNGREAIEQITKPNAIDLVILDLMMPGMSGYEVCQLIRKKYALLELPIIMVTTAIQPGDKLTAFEVGVNDFLSKPFDTTELRARVKSLLVMKESVSKAIDLEVAFLQSQIRPHFLYNALHTIVSLSYTDVEKSRKLTTDLADYLRGSFQFSNLQKRISFGQELILVQSYVEIERARFKDRIRVEYDIAQTMYGVTIPPLLIQPLVENAIRHGISGRIEGGLVTVTAYQTEKYDCIEIEDNGIGMDSGRLQSLLREEPDAPQGVGLRNISKRLKYEYNTELKIESVPGKGTKVTLLLPRESDAAERIG